MGEALRVGSGATPQKPGSRDGTLGRIPGLVGSPAARHLPTGLRTGLAARGSVGQSGDSPALVAGQTSAPPPAYQNLAFAAPFSAALAVPSDAPVASSGASLAPPAASSASASAAPAPAAVLAPPVAGAAASASSSSTHPTTANLRNTSNSWGQRVGVGGSQG